MSLDRARAEEEPLRDFRVREALAEQDEDFVLSRRQAVGSRGNR